MNTMLTLLASEPLSWPDAFAVVGLAFATAAIVWAMHR